MAEKGRLSREATMAERCLSPVAEEGTAPPLPFGFSQLVVRKA